MDKPLRQEIIDFIEPNIKEFHNTRIKNLSKVKLDKILRRKNPYLFKAKNILTAQELVKSLLDAHLSSQEEGIFGDFLETLAIFINNKIFAGQKSAAEGIDLEFTRDKIRYVVSIKSGPNWANHQQAKRMKDNFKQIKKILGFENIIAVNGCCYGKDDKPNKGDYLKLCGQRFWEFISGDENLYIEIVEPLGYRAKEKNDAFAEEYAKVINKFTLEFGKDYCNTDGEILWEKLVKFNSGKKEEK